MTDQYVNKYQEAEQKLLDRFELEARSHFLDLPALGIKTRVLEFGEGEPVLMVHGGGGVSVQWAPLLPYLKDRKVIAVDRPGCGLSDSFTYRGVNLKDHAVSYLDGVLEALDMSSVPVVANSMGAHWTLRLAAERPERVSSMALLGCPAMLLDTTAPFVMRLLSVRGLNSLMWSLQKPSVKLIKNIHKLMGHKIEALERHPEEYWEAVYLSGALPGYKDAWLSLLENVVTPFGARKHTPIDSEYLKRIEQPTMFIWGDNDAFGKSEVGERAVAAMPNASLGVIEGGHLPWLDDTEEVARQVRDWLSRN